MIDSTHLPQVADCLYADKPCVSWGNCLTQLLTCHPIEPSHGSRSFCSIVVVAGDGYERESLGVPEARIGEPARVIWVGRMFQRGNGKSVSCLEKAVTEYAKAKHQPAEHDGIDEVWSRLFNVFDDVRNTTVNKSPSYGLDQSWVFVVPSMYGFGDRISLARWTRPYEIVTVERNRHSIGLDESTASMPGLWIDVHSSDVEAGLGQAGGYAASATEKVEGAKTHSGHYTIPCGIEGGVS